MTTQPNHPTFYLFRHGLATHSTTGYGDRALTADLLPEGKPAAHQLGMYLTQFPVELALTSPVPRCLQTAAIVAKHTGWQFRIEEQATEYYPEVFAPFHNRLTHFAQYLRNLPQQHVAICTHGGVIAGLKHLLTEGSFTESQMLDYPKPAGLIIISEPSYSAIKTIEWTT